MIEYSPAGRQTVAEEESINVGLENERQCRK